MIFYRPRWIADGLYSGGAVQGVGKVTVRCEHGENVPPHGTVELGSIRMLRGWSG
jgi:hypothetical protein